MRKHDVYAAILSILKAIKANPEQLRELTKNTPKYMTIGQHWGTSYSVGQKHYQNPIHGRKLAHMNDIEALRQHFGHSGQKLDVQFHDKPVKAWGKETYEVGPDNSLKFIHADYDTSD